MKINIGNLEIMTYDGSYKQYRFINRISKDKGVRKYLPMNVRPTLLDSIDLDKIELDRSYLIGKNNKPIGFIQICSNYDNVYTLNYGIDRRCRNKGYGTLVLDETSRYLLENTDCRCVKLSVLDENISSNKCAKKAGFDLDMIIAGSVNVYKKRK